jgi:predicted AlkP superfamily phosphohydrolase/phosphomutase
MADAVDSPWARQVRERCLEYFRTVDGLIGQIVTDAGPAATVIIASDHGFGPQVRTFFANTWLEQRGDLAWSGEAPRPGPERLLGIGQLARHIYQLDWQRTRAYAPMPSGNGIHIVRRDAAHPAGVDEAEYEAFRERLMDDLLAVKDDHTGERVVAQLWRREEIFGGPQMELAPDVTLELADGGLISILANETAVAPREEPSGTHRPDGIFLARGRSIRTGVEVADLSILDVAPLVMYSLGLPVSDQYEGRVPESILKPGALDARPIRVASRETAARSTVAAPPVDPDAEAEIMRRLQALGYVE